MSDVFTGFSDDALGLQKYLREEQWTKQSWDDISAEIWKEDIKPQLSSLLSECATALSASTGRSFTSELARPNPHGNVAKWFWGAVVPEGRTRHNDVQLFVALRWGFVRVGLYLKNEDRMKSAVTGLSDREEEVETALMKAKEAGVMPCGRIPDVSSGRPQPIERSEETWAKEFEKRREMDILKAWGVDDDDLRVSEFSSLVLEAFTSLMPFYDLISEEAP